MSCKDCSVLKKELRHAFSFLDRPLCKDCGTQIKMCRCSLNVEINKAVREFAEKVRDIQRVLNIELNLGNYNDDDVRDLQGTVFSAHAKIDELLKQYE